MAGIVSTDQWSVREKLCLASSVIRSGDQNWVSVSRAIKPFGEAGRPPDWFSQKNCACQYSALLETVETPKRKRSERGEVVDTPGDLIVRKMTKERITELKAQLEEDKARYRQLQQEIEQIRSGQADDRLQSTWDEIQEQKRAAKEAEEAQRAAAEAAKAAAAVKVASKPGFQSPSKRRPPIRPPRVGPRTQSETSSVGDNVEVDDNPLTSDIKVTEDLGSGPDDATTKQRENSASPYLTSLVATELQKETDTITNPEEELSADIDNEETVDQLLGATASDLVALLSPYPEDSPSSQSIDESSLPASDHGTPVPRVKEPLILKIEKGVVKTREPKVETKVSKTEECNETEMVNVDDPESDNQAPNPEGSAGNADVADSTQIKSVTSSSTTDHRVDTCSAIDRYTSDVVKTTESLSASIANPPTLLKLITKDEPNTEPQSSKQATPKPNLRSPTRKSMSPEEQKLITQRLDEALYEPKEESYIRDPSPMRWLRSVKDRKKIQLKAPVTDGKAQSQEDQESSIQEKKDEAKNLLPKDDVASALKSNRGMEMKQGTEDFGQISGNISQPKPEVSKEKMATEEPDYTRNAEDTAKSNAGNYDQGRAQSVVIPARIKSPRKATSKSDSVAKHADRHADATPVTKPRADAGEDDYHHIAPPSPGDSSSREDSDLKVKRKGTRGRPPGSQRKSSRIRTHAAAEEEDDQNQLDTPSGRRSAGKDGTASSLVSLIDEDSKDTHSEAGDSDVTDKPSESDDLSTSAGGLQPSYFLDSLPNSPASVAQSEEDHAYKIWRKAIMLVWRAIASHKYANVFLHPVTEDIAPGYKSIVLRPMDLITIKKNIENGVIRTTEQFHRDMMLMFQNAIMYNNADQHVHQIATIMQADVVKQIEEFVSTQLLVQQPDSTKMLRGRGKQGQGEEDRSRRSSTDTDTSGKKRRTRADEY
ncbi:bromodomain-containing protein 8-like isoform X2 [Patiria miniata]|nr:bromodomain-containing protein 8-like isoform X2 [Patiria miniata]XP_038064774.1 bromodomain-containing protein 8-like isoform X2 [Patiria miniata]XP_038064779.1 bromodomain-containing protein 8-like isoform X2 [Patiria miniata]XP_038064787.1 bromodomain-containing protein 8-like isoform X2 [Patiria miniata]XP_038064793.1 bromodomain-containing protein 8-like isoform X2 [Patiria miniata]XP_038064797.1 bromodomain-containing protein 8-like isoform X2 [Patiria miniata]XP_038064805.1 bromodom